MSVGWFCHAPVLSQSDGNVDRFYQTQKDEPQDDKTDNVTCVPSKDADQPGHLLPINKVKTDQTGRMLRLIWAFTVCTDDFVRFPCSGSDTPLQAIYAYIFIVLFRLARAVPGKAL